jgi:hypothetical protein
VSINPRTGLVAWWSGDLDATDIHAGFHGTFHNGAFAGSPGHDGGAFDLSGGDIDYVEIPAGVAQATRGDITIEAWIYAVGSRPQIGATLYTIFSRGNDAEDGWGADLVRHTNDHVSFRIVPLPAPPFHYDVQSDRPIQLGVWHHVVGVRRGETMEIWLDGVMGSMNTPTGGPLRGTGRSTIGMALPETHPYGPNTEFDGLIDEVAIWNTALSRGVIRALYHAGRPDNCKD